MATSPSRSGVIKRFSSLGRVQNIGRKRTGYPHFPRADKFGYCTSTVKGIGAMQVHTIVQVLFNDPQLEDWSPGCTVDHKDRNRSNNSNDNLDWATRSQQCKNRSRSSSGTASFGRKRGSPVEVKRSTNSSWEWYPSGHAAERALGIGRGTIANMFTKVGSSGRQMQSGVEIRRAAQLESDSIQGELWKQVPGTNGQISSMGRVKPDPRGSVYTPTVANGMSVTTFGGVCRQTGNWMLRAFVGPPCDDETCDHIDGDPLNNNLENLRWATKSEQIANRRQILKVTGWSPQGCSNLPLEEWRDFRFEDWACGGKYACVFNRSGSTAAHQS